MENASYAVVYFCTDTNYKLSSKIFLEQDNLKKLEYEDVRPKVNSYLEAAEALGYDKLKERHISDYRSIFARTEFELECDIPEDETPEPVSYTHLKRRKLH